MRKYCSKISTTDRNPKEKNRKYQRSTQKKSLEEKMFCMFKGPNRVTRSIPNHVMKFQNPTKTEGTLQGSTGGRNGEKTNLVIYNVSNSIDLRATL